MTRTSRADRPVRGDRGATLIIAIGFVVMIGTIAAGLSSLVVSAMGDRLILAELRDRQYAADGAIELAVAHVRSLDVAHGGTCSAPPGHIVDVLNEQSIRVDWKHSCTSVRGGDGVVVQQRNATFVACPDTGAACTPSTAVISAQINFQQSTAGAVTHTYVQTWSVTG